MRDLLNMPSETVHELDRVAPAVTGLRVVMVNLYAISNADRSWVLIDAGLPMSASRIKAWTSRHFGADSKPSCILLTHGHFDHVGSLRDLAEEWDVPIYAHPMERPYLTGRSKYPPPDPTVGGGALASLSSLYPRGPINVGDRLLDLPEDGTVPGLPQWRWIHTPGHSPGHVLFFRDEDRVLIAGDAFVTTKMESFVAVFTQRPVMHGPPAHFTPDWEAAKLSLARLAGLLPTVVACGHGLPLVGPIVADELEYLAENFDDIALPAHGRYVREPAVMDEDGVVTLPHPLRDPLKQAAFGLAIVGALFGLFSLTRKLVR